MKEMTETKTGIININGMGTRHWVEPGYPIMEAIFGQGPKNRDEVIAWCMETFDKADWDIHTPHEINRYLFKNKEDRLVFMLKWCQYG
jgi:hypothetical protein